MNNSYALIIGVGKDLPVTVKDANAIADILCDKSYCAYLKENVKLLCDKDSTKDSIIDGLQWLIETAQEESTVIIYFSGHGIQTPNYYLVPFNFQTEDIPGTAISEDEFSRSVSQIKAKKIVVFLDCCHAEGQLNFKGFKNSPLPEKFAREFSSGKGKVIIASSRENELSLTSSPYSEFTNALVEALAGYGNERGDGITKIFDIYHWVDSNVSRRTLYKQNPTIKIRSLDENFSVGFYSAGRKELKKLPWTAGDLSTDFPIKVRESIETLKKQLRIAEKNRDDEEIIYANLFDVKNELKMESSRYRKSKIPKDLFSDIESNIAEMAEASIRVTNLKNEIQNLVSSIHIVINTIKSNKSEEEASNEEEVDTVTENILEYQDSRMENPAETGQFIRDLGGKVENGNWFDKSHLDKIPIPIFVVDNEHKKQIINWNKFCTDYYRIPEHRNDPINWTVDMLFEQIDMFSKKRNSLVRKRTLEFYENEVKTVKLHPNGKHSFTVFLEKSDDDRDIDGFREFNRITNVYYKAIDSAHLVAMIQTIPVETDVIGKKQLIEHLKTD